MSCAAWVLLTGFPCCSAAGQLFLFLLLFIIYFCECVLVFEEMNGFV
jgi:hypothetical protein